MAETNSLKIAWTLHFTQRTQGWDFLGGPVVKNLPCIQGMLVKSLVRELGYHMLQSNNERPHMMQLRPDTDKEININKYI